jgi:hypothetical protein
MNGACSIPEGKIPFGDWHKWKDDTEVDLKEIGYEDVGWIKLAQYRIQWLIIVKMW